ncbi:uncharacterized protein LOC126326049 [Schistocerca gregaria]|uniref:uncharacterized protein LOC126326049 n=1 Tax=Schistocerca gregaria TaxID=7010 RepID=UPI00211DDDF3|nr:uncharacterized protein LOC126326049 [Schistocerca gregaria]
MCEKDEEEGAEEWVPLKVRKQRRMEELRDRLKSKVKRQREGVEAEKLQQFSSGPLSKKSLFEEHFTRDALERKVGEEVRRAEQEEEILRAMTQDMPLQSVAARAHGVVFTESLKTSWRPPRWILERSGEEERAIRQKRRVDVSGEEVPPLVERFEDLKLPGPVLKFLHSRNIVKPSPIQMQGLPVILSGRDMIGVAHTGSGKTVVFVLPIVLFALEEQMKLPLRPEEGPLGLIICPSRELAQQTYDFVNDLCLVLARSGYPPLHPLCLIGGTRMHEQEQAIRYGCHVVVATPGRLIHWLKERKMSLMFCRYLCMDEADRLIDVGFEDEIRTIMDHFVQQRQTVLFSATMPKTIQRFAMSALVRPVEVNVGRAGAASLDVLQEVEYVLDEAKLTYLLECLQKTPPPVLIFCENKSDVDDIHEYLLLKGVEAVCIHGGKDQTDRLASIRAFKAGQKDVLIATDVASKGLDFPKIQHVINFDMPKEIENYVHRIGRTGRGGHTGLATTFINKMCNPNILLDLKQLLIEAKQRVPPFLQTLETDIDLAPMGVDPSFKGCSYCGGLGHRITNCAKAEVARNKQLNIATGVNANSREFRGGGEY